MKIFSLMLLLLFSSCQKRGIDSASIFSKSGELKDKIAFVKMIDSSSSEQPWNIAEELSALLEKDIARKDTLYVLPAGDTIKLSKSKNPFSENLSWLEESFSQSKYAVFTELLKYEETTPSAASSNLELAVRVRVFEKTANGYNVILQEIVEESYMLPKGLFSGLHLEPARDAPGYDLSPRGLAHHNFSKLIAKRIRSYITQP